MSMYTEEIMDLYAHPLNRGRIEHADIDHLGNNPLCGDVAEVTANIKDGKIGEVKCLTKGCAISQVSASLITDQAVGKSLDEVLKWDRDFSQDLLGTKLTTMRVKCAVLPLKVLQDGIKKFKEGKGE